MRGDGGSIAQVLRLLHLIPAAHRDGGVRYSEVARELGVPEPTIRRDVEHLLERSSYLRAGHAGQIQAELRPDGFQIWAPGPFDRPPRLTGAEALALVLGLRSRALLRGLSADDAADGVLQRLEGALASRESLAADALPMEDASPTPPGGEFRDAALDAIGGSRVLSIAYLKAGAPGPEKRRVEPAALAHAEGTWYLLGRDPEGAAESRKVRGGERDEMEGGPPPDFRAFRMDRILELELTEETFAPLEDLDLRQVLNGSRVFFTAGEVREVAVVYSRRISRWLRERYDGDTLADGSFRVVHSVADPDWLVRHVLQYGGEARAEGEGSRWVRRALEG
ncbi:MAG: WYL domain-containing protein [Gemmatimonadota bacterium]